MSTRRPWTDAERALLRELYADTPTAVIAARLGRPLKAVYQQARTLGLSKSPHYMTREHGARAREVGKATRFVPGQVSWNKGQHYLPGGRCPETQFRPGNTPHNWVPVGSYRLNGDGYLDRKVSDLRRGARDWEAVHRLVWKEVHGEIPSGHAVVFKPGRRTTVLEEITPDALELVTRQELMRRNTVHRLPPELKDTIRTLGVLNRKINARTKHEEPDGGSAQSLVRNARGAAGRGEADGA